MIQNHLDKNNLHHAYLIEGVREDVLPEILSFMKVLDVPTDNNPDFCEIHVDNFKIDEALSLRSMTEERGLSNKKVFIISVNKFSLDAEHALLKLFEEPKNNTHFFLIIPDKNALLSTLFSRFYFIPSSVGSKHTEEAKNFIKMSLNNRINFLKDFLVEDEENEEAVETDSVRAKSLRFLNLIETELNNNKNKNSLAPSFEQIFKVRKFLRQPGSSTKSLMESVALLIPNF